MAKKGMDKQILKQVQLLIEEEADESFIEHNVRYVFHHYSGEVQTVYVFQENDSPNPVEHYMLEELQNKLQKINSRYRVGIMYQGQEANTGS